MFQSRYFDFSKIVATQRNNLKKKSFLSWGAAPNPTRKLFAKSFLDFQKPWYKKHFMLLRTKFLVKFFTKNLCGVGA